MRKALKNHANRTLTENGAAAFRTSGSDCLDLFATIGALREADEDEIVLRFTRAWAEDPDLALKILFYARDIRGGLGERRVFRVILRWLANQETFSVRRNIPLVAEYGRFDDLLVLLDTACEREVLSFISKQLARDFRNMELGGEVSLLAKWLPSVNASNKKTVYMAKQIARSMNMNDAQYRRMLSALRGRISILENYLRERDYRFDYEKQPSKAMFQYRRAFLRNDGPRYCKYLARVSEGRAVLHTGTLMPYELVRRAVDFRGSEAERMALNVTWNNLESSTDGRNALAVVDGSGSMYFRGNPYPRDVAISLALYFAERNKGAFRNHFITFSETPRLVEIKGRDLVDRVRYCRTYNEVANTNIQKVFELILDAALSEGLPQSELPETLYFISDMEFDFCTRDASLTNFAYAKQLYAAKGYRLPEVVFWNVQSRNEQQPVSMNEQGAVLVSGASPRIFSMVVSGDANPYTHMIKVLSAARYDAVKA